MFNTSEGYHDACGGYHEYIGGSSVHRRDTMMHVEGCHYSCGGYHEYIGGCSVHRGFQYKSKAFYQFASPHES